MKRILTTVGASLCAAVCALTFTACDNAGKSTLLGAPAEPENLSYIDYSGEELSALRQATDAFAARFSAAAYVSYGENKNFSVSPVSAYMALSLAAECAGGDTRTEITSALGVSYDTLKTSFGKLYASLNQVSTGHNLFGQEKQTGALSADNSIWVNEGTAVNSDCVETLSDKFYAYSYSADFLNDNKNANAAVRHFVKERTNGLIDYNFELSPETLFTIVNTLYLKELWNVYADELDFTDDEYEFIGSDGAKRINLLQGYYNPGRYYDGENFTAFYTSTCHGYNIKFVVPKDGYSIGGVFTSENIAEVNSISQYDAYDYENLLRYNTRCLFPEFETSCDEDLKPVLSEEFGIYSMFDPYKSDFTTLTDDSVYCDEVRHVTKLTVNKYGVEGAAVTVIPGAGAAGPDEWTDVYVDFVIDRAFGFILTDAYGTTLFSGVVNNV